MFHWKTDIDYIIKIAKFAIDFFKFQVFESIFHLLINFPFFHVIQQCWQSTISFHFNKCLRWRIFFIFFMSNARQILNSLDAERFNWYRKGNLLLSCCALHLCQGLVLSTRLTVTVISEMAAEDIYAVYINVVALDVLSCWHIYSFLILFYILGTENIPHKLNASSRMAVVFPSVTSWNV